MTDRVLDISEAPARLHIRSGLLVVESNGREQAAIPCAELSAVVIGHRQVVLTQSVLSELAKAGALLITCDEKFQPASMVLPLKSHHAQAERFRRQAQLSLPRKKSLWKTIVQAKIRAQAGALEQAAGSDGGLRALIPRVRSGDPDNVEARAARRYWSLLFGERPFRRADEQDARNHLLDYGYAVLRSMVARAVCAAGLHPTLGLYHSNVHNAFGLADDLMEPFRPLVDLAVLRRPCWELTSEAKLELISHLLCRF
ncbi:MAG TPA: type II CRISPR-associated endonuclease Cas1, partial [Bryobacteraceae bacterium]